MYIFQLVVTPVATTIIFGHYCEYRCVCFINIINKKHNDCEGGVYTVLLKNWLSRETWSVSPYYELALYQAKPYCACIVGIFASGGWIS